MPTSGPALGVILDLEPDPVALADLNCAAGQHQEGAELLGLELPDGRPFVDAPPVRIEGGICWRHLSEAPFHGSKAVILGVLKTLGVEEQGIGGEVLRPSGNDGRGCRDPGTVTLRVGEVIKVACPAACRHRRTG